MLATCEFNPTHRSVALLDPGWPWAAPPQSSGGGQGLVVLLHYQPLPAPQG